MHGLHKRKLLGSLDGSMRGLWSRRLLRYSSLGLRCMRRRSRDRHTGGSRRHHMHIVPCGLFLGSLDRSVCSVCGWLEDRCAGGQGRHDLHCMRGWEVLRSIDTSMHELCSRTVCGVDGIERIECLHWVLGGEVRGRDGVGVGVGMHSMRRWLSDRHAGVGGRHEVHGLHKRELLGSLDGSMRGL